MTAAKKRPPRATKGKKAKARPGRDYRRLIAPLLLLSLLVVSLLAVGYVIFFRTVVAGELPGQVAEGSGPALVTRGEEQPEEQRGLPKVAIIIDDLGYDERIGMELLDFPIELTYSFLPYAPFTRKLSRLAHRHGKTVFLHLPLEPKDSSKDPGPGALYLADSPEEQREKFESCLSQVPYARGVNNHMGSAFTADKEAMANILSVARQRSLVFVDSITTPDSLGVETARQAGLKVFSRAVFLDNVIDEDIVCIQLEKLVREAERAGLAIGIGHPHRETRDAIARCAATYAERVAFVGIGQIVQ